MSKHVVIEEKIDDLRRHHWRFWYSDDTHRLVLDTYVREERATTRHKHKVTGVYVRLRGSRYDYETTPLTLAQVPWPLDLATRAIAAFVSGLTVSPEPSP